MELVLSYLLSMTILIFYLSPLIYIWVIIKLIQMIRNEYGIKRNIAISALLFAVLAPSMDIALNKLSFSNLCKKESGVFVTKKVGLPEEFFFQKGELIKKFFIEDNGSYKLNEVKANGDEIKHEKLKQHYRVEYDSEKLITEHWLTDTIKEEYIVWDGDEILGRHVRLKGGAGWYLKNLFLTSGYICPTHASKEGLQKDDRLIINEIFYKTSNGL